MSDYAFSQQKSKTPCRVRAGAYCGPAALRNHPAVATVAQRANGEPVVAQLSVGERSLADDLIRHAGIPMVMVDTLPEAEQARLREEILSDFETAVIHGNNGPPVLSSSPDITQSRAAEVES